MSRSSRRRRDASRWARALELGVVAPGNLALIGGRAAPPDAPALRVLEELGAHTFSVADVASAGMATVAQEALEAAAAGTEAVYLSVDLGVLEGGADPVGLTARELVEGVTWPRGASSPRRTSAATALRRRRRQGGDRGARRRRDRRRRGAAARLTGRPRLRSSCKRFRASSRRDT